jgi:hypothetical protein
VQHEVEVGRLRGILDRELTALSLIGMALFPFITNPVTREVFGLKMDDALFERLIDHLVGLFAHNAAAVKML